MIFDKYFRDAWKEADKRRKQDKLKERFLDKKIDYQYLEELIQKINENPLLQITIKLKDGTVLNLNTKPKNNPLEFIEPKEDFLEVK